MTNALAVPWKSDQLTDAEIVTRVVAGDSALFEMLMRRHNQRLYRVVRAVLGSDEETEDVLQQAWLNAYRHLGQFAGQAQFATWLTRIAVNEAIARRRTHRGEEDQVTLAIADSRTPDPEQQAASSEMREVLEEEVAALPDSYRVVFVMRDVEGLSTGETATCLNVSEDVIKTRLHRARALLRERLYERAGVTATSLFSFGNARCDRVVAAVMAQIS